LEKKLGITHLEDWFGVTIEQVQQYGGKGILQGYNNSLPKALSALYPNHEWWPWRFHAVPKDFWENSDNILSFLNWLGPMLQIRELSDWYRISIQQIQRVGAPTTVFYTKGFSILKNAYPSFNWDLDKLTNRKWPIKAAQRNLAIVLSDLFADKEILEDYRHENMCFKSGSPMYLDIYVPEYFLAFEYQGEQHYRDVYHLGSQYVYAQRDMEKREACKLEGITLIDVPFWWDGQKSSLEATIHMARPDVVRSTDGVTIPVNPLPQLNALTNLAFAQNWDGNQDPSGW
jgi:hypothetical protein